MRRVTSLANRPESSRSRDSSMFNFARGKDGIRVTAPLTKEEIVRKMVMFHEQ